MMSRVSPKSWLTIKLHRYKGDLPTTRRQAEKAATEKQKTEQIYQLPQSWKQEPVCNFFNPGSQIAGGTKDNNP